MFFHGIPNFLSVGQTLWCLTYRTTSCFCFTVYWHRMNLTLVGSSPWTGRCTVGTRKFSSSLAYTWPSLSSGCFPSGSPHSSLDSLLLFHWSEGSSDIVLCTNTSEVVCLGHHLAWTLHTRVSGHATSVPTVWMPPKINSKAQGHLWLEWKKKLRYAP